VLPLQRAHLLGADEGDAELAVLDSLGRQHPSGQLDRSLVLDFDPAPVLHLDGDHRYLSRCVPVSSAY
jgi:hypothetical protein